MRDLLNDSEHLEKAAATMTMHHMPISLRARVVHLFSRACLADDNRREEGFRQRAKAQRLRQLLLGGKDAINEDFDEAYDVFVNVLDR